MKNKIIIPFLLLHILGFAQKEKDALPLIKYQWSTEHLKGSDSNCDRVVQAMYGFKWQTVKSAVNKEIEKWERHNKSVDQELKKRYGKNWAEDYDAHIARCELGRLANSLERRGYQSISTQHFKVNDKIIAPYVQFASGGPRIPQPGLDSLKVVADFITKHPDMLVEIGVHADIRGEEGYNLQLTKHRAEQIKKALQFEFGLSSRSFSVKGYGEAIPLIPKHIILKTDKRYQERLYRQNHRIELVVKSIE